MPSSASAAPTRPPTSAWPELDGSPRHQVSTFQVDRRGEPGADHRDRLRRRHGHDAGDRGGDGRADEQRAEHVEHRRESERLAGPCAPRRDERRDRVRGVVEPVREGEREASAIARPSPIARSSGTQDDVSARRRLEVDGPVVPERPVRVVRDLPRMPVGIDEDARVAAPEGRARPRARCSRPPSAPPRSPRRPPPESACCTRASPRPSRRRPRHPSPPRAIRGSTVRRPSRRPGRTRRRRRARPRRPAERLVERPRTRQVGDAEGDQRDALFHSARLR